ncbi:hypothetical protein [Sphingomonas sp. TDK1]|uniref:hypothetical protein n=1 Tax=Sphingomonas sp. TDK1 TaxID=453247 RepID=UPI0007D983B7|nr:hypothetical protein [Sphingomonas sp. TDK1]OAN58881.1 hypothetical protein A7X12_04375 [Sphingomonas sp. TDK1]
MSRVRPAHLALRGIFAMGLLLALGACKSDQQILTQRDTDLALLHQMEKAKGTPGYAQFCDRPLTCTSSVADACPRIYDHIGAACLARADAMSATAPAAQMRKVTGSAEAAFRKGLAGGSADVRRVAATGLGEALELRRAFSPNVEIDGINAALNANADTLQTLPGDAAQHAGYYRAGVLLNQALRVAAISSAQCPQLAAALAALPTTPGADATFSDRLAQRRAQITQARTTRSCS